MTPVQGVSSGGRRWTEVQFRVGGERRIPVVDGRVDARDVSVPIASPDGDLPSYVTGVSTEAERAAGEAVLREGGAVAFTDQGVTRRRDRARGSLLRDPGAARSGWGRPPCRC